MTSARLLLCAACAGAALAACAGAPPAATELAAPASSPKSLTTVPLGKLKMTLPAAWQAKPITSKMRAADYAVSADAELIIYYFGPNGAGSVDDNVARWLGQFTNPDGTPVKDAATIDKRKVAGFDATFVAIGGHYVAEAMAGNPAVDKPDAELLAAIVDSPDGPYYFRLLGGKSAVDLNASAFNAMLASLVVSQ